MLHVFFLMWGLFAAWGVEVERPEISSPTAEASTVEDSDDEPVLSPMCCDSPPPPCPPACGGSG